MRVLLGVPWYYPDSMGGTETYVRNLAQQLDDRGLEVAVAAPTWDEQPREYVHEGVQVFRFREPRPESGAIALDRPEPRGWSEVLARFSPAIVDFHAVTSGLDLAHLRAASRFGARTVLTLHLPDVICARGTLMLFGKTPCNGDLGRQPCTACRLEAQGVPPTLGRLLARVPEPIATLSTHLPAVLHRSLSAASKDRVKRDWFRLVVSQVDRLVVPSRWFVDVLVRNHVPPAKIVLCRQGVGLAHLKLSERAVQNGAMKVGFVGRYDRVKGLHVLLDALTQIPDGVPLEIHVWGVARSPGERAYRADMKARINGNSKVTFHEETEDTTSVYRQIDVLAVPSLWFETGPLVVLEAQSAGVPVVGSDLGGIAERVVDGEDGILVPPGDSRRLAEALTALAGDRTRLNALRPRRRPRTITDVANQTLRTYEQLAGSAA